MRKAVVPRLDWAVVASICGVAFLLLSGCGGDSGSVPGPSGPGALQGLQVISTVPRSRALDVDPSTTVEIAFNNALNAETATRAEFVLVDSGNQPISAGLEYDTAEKKLVLSPTLPLQEGQSYTAFLTHEVVDQTGSHLPVDFSWTFTVREPALPATVVYSPNQGAVGVSVKVAPSVSFPRVIDSASLASDIMSLSDAASVAIPGTVKADGNVLSLSPSVELAVGTEYTARLKPGLKLLGGQTISQELTWRFTTATTRQFTVQLNSGQVNGVFAVATDAVGNVYAAGMRTVTDVIDPGTGRPTVSDVGLVLKVDATGRVLWQRTVGDPGSHAYFWYVGVDSRGEVVAVGDVVHGPLADPGDSGQMLVVKLTGSTGEEVWRKTLGSGIEMDTAMAVAIGGGDDVFVAGNSMGAFPGQTSAGGYDGVVMRLAGADGSLKWATQLGSTEDDFLNGVAFDGQGAVFVVGNSYGALSGQANQGFSDVLLAKFDAASGALVASRLLGTIQHDEGTAIVVAGGRVVVGGLTEGALATAQTSLGQADAFVLALDPSLASTLWTQQFGTLHVDMTTALAVDGAGAVYAAGFGESDGSGPAMEMTGFLRKLAGANGGEIWRRELGSTSNAGHVAIWGVAVDSGGNAFAGGQLHGAASLEEGGTPIDNETGFVVGYTASGSPK